MLKSSLTFTQLPEQEIAQEVRDEKYAKLSKATEKKETVAEIRTRVAKGLVAKEKLELQDSLEKLFHKAMENGFIPAGRISSAGGTDIEATLINCFVQGVADSISETKNGKPGIYIALKEAAETMRRGGGVGYNFSQIRPRNAKVKGTASNASGPVSYMRVFDRSCETVESAGARRGAQMGMLNDHHPDIEEFIHAKDKGDLTNFNISVAVSDAFMKRVEEDGDWELWHEAEPSLALQEKGAYQREDGKWVYQVVKAKDLWQQIMESTYDHAEPGVIFIDTANKKNNLRYCEVFEATNPCVTGDSRLATDKGLVRIDSLYQSKESMLVTVDTRAFEGKFGATTRPVTHAFKTADSAPVYKITTKAGYSLKATEWHKFHVEGSSEFVSLKDLKVGSRLWIQSGEGQFGTLGSAALGRVLGVLAGDGHFSSDGQGNDRAVLSFWSDDEGVSSQLLADVNELLKDVIGGNNRTYQLELVNIPSENKASIASVLLARELAKFEVTKDTKLTVPEVVYQGTRECVVGYLQGLFYADGTVMSSEEKRSCDVRLSSVKHEFLEEIQVLLANFGIFSKIYSRRKAGNREMPNGKGGVAEYPCQESFDLIISKESRDKFLSEIGFLGTKKNQKARDFVGNGVRGAYADAFVSEIVSIDFAGEEAVYDVTQPDKNSIIFNGIATGNCAEEFLPDYGCCCLGSINLTLFVRKPFTSEAYFDFDAFSQTIRPAIRMLDNVLDVTFWPLPQQKQEAQDKRRVGLGFTGLGNALAMLTLKYDTAEAQAMAKKIADFMTRESYLASVDLAREKGAFPKFVADKFLEEGTFASTLDADVKEAIRLHGIRNSHLNAIAPTGTISLAFADNASNGIEPPFSYTYQRKKRMSDGSVKVYDVEDYAYRLYRHLGGDVSKLPPYFTTALEIGTEGHLGMMTAVVNSIDTSVSKTVNVPEDYPYEEFKDLYFKAWRAGLKGLATYRPNSTLGSVLSVKEEKPKEEKVSAETFDQTDKDRRIVLKEAVVPALSSLKWPSRPETPQGNDSWTYMVYHQFGKFATIVGHLVGSKHPLPFEVWVTGSEIPRGLEAIAKSLSSDLRTQDRTWIDMKLSALSSLEGDDGFMMPFPPQGQEQWIPSTAAAVARIVQFRLSELLGPTTKAKSPMVEALFSKKKPKTGPEGTLSWTVDIYNPQTEEEFSVLLKEVVLPNGDTRPYAIELSGNYPKAYDGLMSMLSLDMRVIDPAWIGMKLRGLLDYAEPRGDFMAFNPFTGKQQTWASTLAYVATTVLFRYFKLGILTEEGFPVKDMGVLEKPEKPKRNAKPTTDNKVMGGKPCKECGQNAVIKKDGCQFCTACGWVGSCG